MGDLDLLSAWPTEADLQRLVTDNWQALLDRDDRTSPEEYPDMVLITYEEYAAAFRYWPHALAEFLPAGSAEGVAPQVGSHPPGGPQ